MRRRTIECARMAHPSLSSTKTPTRPAMASSGPFSPALSPMASSISLAIRTSSPFLRRPTTARERRSHCARFHTRTLFNVVAPQIAEMSTSPRVSGRGQVGSPFRTQTIIICFPSRIADRLWSPGGHNSHHCAAASLLFALSDAGSHGTSQEEAQKGQQRRWRQWHCQSAALSIQRQTWRRRWFGPILWSARLWHAHHQTEQIAGQQTLPSQSGPRTSKSKRHAGIETIVGRAQWRRTAEQKQLQSSNEAIHWSELIAQSVQRQQGPQCQQCSHRSFGQLEPSWWQHFAQGLAKFASFASGHRTLQAEEQQQQLGSFGWKRSIIRHYVDHLLRHLFHLLILKLKLETRFIDSYL